jgi:TonB family protein
MLSVDNVDPLIGRTLGDFVVREKFGQGGFGAVYKADQKTLLREAVIKVLHSYHTNDLKILERFTREAKLASTLEHPYTAHIYAFGVESDGLMWIAMEFVRGIPLNELLKTEGPIPLDAFISLLDKICEVVHTAHEGGIVHRDLKPANVMVIQKAGQLLPKLLDFGIAKALNINTELNNDSLAQSPSTSQSDAQDKENTVGTTVGVVGSPRYMAPEQWATNATVDARTDIYALGVLTYECLTGTPPFNGEYYALAFAHASQKVPALSSDFPKALNEVISKAMAKQPEERFKTAIEFASALRAAIENKNPIQLPLQSDTPKHNTKLFRFLAAGIIVMLLMAVGIGLLLLNILKTNKPVNSSQEATKKINLNELNALSTQLEKSVPKDEHKLVDTTGGLDITALKTWLEEINTKMGIIQKELPDNDPIKKQLLDQLMENKRSLIYFSVNGISNISGVRRSEGVMRGNAIDRPTPSYPDEAKKARIEGDVVVEVIIDERGTVIYAYPTAGHPLLQAASVEAARHWKFKPTLLNNESVKITGVLTFRFKL